MVSVLNTIFLVSFGVSTFVMFCLNDEGDYFWYKKLYQHRTESEETLNIATEFCINLFKSE